MQAHTFSLFGMIRIAISAQTPMPLLHTPPLPLDLHELIQTYQLSLLMKQYQNLLHNFFERHSPPLKQAFHTQSKNPPHLAPGFHNFDNTWYSSEIKKVCATEVTQTEKCITPDCYHTNHFGTSQGMHKWRMHFCQKQNTFPAMYPILICVVSSS